MRKWFSQGSGGGVKRLCIAILIVVSAAGSPQRATADPEECQEAIEEYKSAISDASAALTLYTSCISDSKGHDDCSSEFEGIRSAQDDFESTVSKYQSECN
jgi:hypothetical protein